MFGAQLDRVVAERPDHVVVTGDLLDRWSESLLDHTIGVFAARDLLNHDRLTIIHGNHDLASSGGHPRGRGDLWRLISRFWDPPPLLAARRRRFYERIGARAKGVGLAPATAKTVSIGIRLATVDTVATPWLPLRVGRGTLTLHHARGAIPAAQLRWLAQQRGPQPLIVLIHHYPLQIDPYRWQANPPEDGRHRWHVVVPMHIDPEDQARFWDAVEGAGAAAVLCGHVHRARLEHRGTVAIGLNGQSGAAWAGRTVAYYRLDGGQITVSY